MPGRSGRFSTRSPATRATLLTSFVSGDAGPWAVERIDPVIGPPLPQVATVALIGGGGARLPPEPAWVLSGAVGQERYTTRKEHDALASRQQPLGLPTATRAALIPITKSKAWWRFSQEKRRAIFEETSHHIAIGMEYLPAVARRLYHGRDLGEPFDFLTWFEFAPEHEAAFDELVACGRPRNGLTSCARLMSACEERRDS
jgi:hypothetical protein